MKLTAGGNWTTKTDAEFAVKSDAANIPRFCDVVRDAYGATGPLPRGLILASSAAHDRADENGAYALYRSSVVEEMRIHIATFNAAEGEAYNRENCLIAADLFEAQPGVQVR